MLTLYLLGMDGRLAKYRGCDQVWIIAGISVPVNAFGASSSYLVALIVLLRLLMIKRPMNFQSSHKSVSRIGCIVIWVVSLLIPLTKFIVSLPVLYNAIIVDIFSAIQNYGLITAPILLTALLYGMLLCYLKTQRRAHRNTSLDYQNDQQIIRRMKALAKMTHGVVAGLIVCNVPGLIYNAYFGYMIGRGRGDDIFKSTISV